MTQYTFLTSQMEARMKWRHITFIQEILTLYYNQIRTNNIKDKVYMNMEPRKNVDKFNWRTMGVITNKGNTWTCENMTYMMEYTIEACWQDKSRSCIHPTNICTMYDRINFTYIREIRVRGTFLWNKFKTCMLTLGRVNTHIE